MTLLQSERQEEKRHHNRFRQNLASATLLAKAGFFADDVC